VSGTDEHVHQRPGPIPFDELDNFELEQTTDKQSSLNREVAKWSKPGEIEEASGETIVIP